MREIKVKVLAFLMVVAQCICPSRAHKDESKEPLPHAEWDELLVVCLMSGLIAVATWEFGRWMYRKARRALKRRRKARQLDDVSKLALPRRKLAVNYDVERHRVRHPNGLTTRTYLKQDPRLLLQGDLHRPRDLLRRPELLRLRDLQDHRLEHLQPDQLRRL